MKWYKLLCKLILASPIIGIAVSISLIILLSCSGDEGSGMRCQYAPDEFGNFLLGIALMSVFGWLVTTPLGLLMLYAGKLVEKRRSTSIS